MADENRKDLDPKVHDQQAQPESDEKTKKAADACEPGEGPAAAQRPPADS